MIATLDEIERTIQIATLALSSARASLDALRRQAALPPRDEIGRFAKRVLDRAGVGGDQTDDLFRR